MHGEMNCMEIIHVTHYSIPYASNMTVSLELLLIPTEGQTIYIICKMDHYFHRFCLSFHCLFSRILSLLLFCINLQKDDLTQHFISIYLIPVHPLIINNVIYL